MLGVDIAETVFEPRVGGHIYDRGVDGSECHWARVLAYEPPDRVVFSWDISPHWQIETDPDKTSEVEVRFIAEAPERTRVELEHRNLDRHGDGWEGVRDGVAATRAGRCTCSATPTSPPATADAPDHVARPSQRAAWLAAVVPARTPSSAAWKMTSETDSRTYTTSSSTRRAIARAARRPR